MPLPDDAEIKTGAEANKHVTHPSKAPLRSIADIMVLQSKPHHEFGTDAFDLPGHVEHICFIAAVTMRGLRGHRIHYRASYSLSNSPRRTRQWFAFAWNQPFPNLNHPWTFSHGVKLPWLQGAMINFWLRHLICPERFQAGR